VGANPEPPAESPLLILSEPVILVDTAYSADEALIDMRDLADSREPVGTLADGLIEAAKFTL
jgi:hypothetical protein